jgi:hypothetical protein
VKFAWGNAQHGLPTSDRGAVTALPIFPVKTLEMAWGAGKLTPLFCGKQTQIVD